MVQAPKSLAVNMKSKSRDARPERRHLKQTMCPEWHTRIINLDKAGARLSANQYFFPGHAHVRAGAASLAVVDTAAGVSTVVDDFTLPDTLVVPLERRLSMMAVVMASALPVFSIISFPFNLPNVILSGPPNPIR